MGTLGTLVAFLVLGNLLLPQVLQPTEVQASALPSSLPGAHSRFAQSAIQVLDREFTSSDLSFLLIDAQTGGLLSSRWENPSKPIPLGSLIKPFTALAYAESHQGKYPSYICKGAKSGCWQIRPHGRLDIVSAIGVSCNSYFRELSANLTVEQFLPVTTPLGLDAPNPTLIGPDLMGLGSRWPISPLRMARAYIELYKRRDQPGVQELLTGMAQSALRGTGAGVGRNLKHSDALVKTGTAPCTHPHSAPADGFVLAMVPATNPEIVLMIRVHEVAAAKASETAGRMLRRMEE